MSLKLSKALYELRGNVTQVAMAAKVGVSQSTYARWELGLSVPTLENAEALARAFDRTLDAFTAYVDAMQVESGDSWYPRRWNDTVARWKERNPKVKVQR